MERELLQRQADLDRKALYQQATHDPLTGLYNRAYLEDFAHRMCATDDRDDDHRLAVLMVDIDHFKRVNDEHGHPVGDDVLRHVARAIERTIRAGDVAVRFGGEEFVVVLASVDEQIARSTADRIRVAIGRPETSQPRVTASVGVAMRRRGDGCHDLVGRADAALYTAKRLGRDRVCVAP
jgi:diguanylate cyclase (GGDEF)-like protein